MRYKTPKYCQNCERFASLVPMPPTKSTKRVNNVQEVILAYILLLLLLLFLFFIFYICHTIMYNINNPLYHQIQIQPMIQRTTRDKALRQVTHSFHLYQSSLLYLISKVTQGKQLFMLKHEKNLSWFTLNMLQYYVSSLDHRFIEASLRQMFVKLILPNPEENLLLRLLLSWGQREGERLRERSPSSQLRFHI